MTPTIWLLGLSGSGKTTLGSLVRLYLEGQGLATTFIDGDNFRRQYGFSGSEPHHRLRQAEALREHALEMHGQGKICIVADVTPYAAMRQKNRECIPFYREVWVRCSLKSLVERDPKGFYARAAQGENCHLSGLNDTFDEPLNADSIVDTDRLSLAESYVALRDVCLDSLEECRRWDHTRSSLLPAPLLDLGRRLPPLFRCAPAVVH